MVQILHTWIIFFFFVCTVLLQWSACLGVCNNTFMVQIFTQCACSTHHYEVYVSVHLLIYVSWYKSAHMDYLLFFVCRLTTVLLQWSACLGVCNNTFMVQIYTQCACTHHYEVYVCTLVNICLMVQICTICACSTHARAQRYTPQFQRVLSTGFNGVGT